MTRAVRAAFRAAMAVVGAVLVVWVLSGVAVVAFARTDNARAADAIVVLGAAQYAGRPSPVLRARMDHALALWRGRLARSLVVTGGVGPGDTTSEAEVARRYAERNGVPGDRIIVEPRGRTTSESMQAVAGILQEREMESAVLVSDPFHMFRLWLLAQRYGFRAHTSPTRGGSINSNREANWQQILRESVKAPASLFLHPSR